MKKNWNKLNKFVKNIKNFGQINTNMSIEKIITKEKSTETLFLEEIQRIMDNDSHRKAFLEFCDQNSVLSFEDVFDPNLYRDLVRFDYGSYAELFSGINNETNELVVLKVIRAISSDLKNRIKGPDFSSKEGLFEEIHNEFQISDALSELNSLEKYETRCFPHIFGKYLVSGDIPEYLLKDNTCESSGDQLPPIREEVFEDFVSIPREYAILVMSYGGQPLWKAMKERSITSIQLLSVIRQLTIGLAVAEAAVEFEHRDLHISNILIRNTTKQKIHFIYNFNRYSVDSEGFEATIIDTTFSRIRIGNRIHSKNLTNIMKFDENSELSSQDKCYKSMVRLTKYSIISKMILSFKSCICIVSNDWNKFTPKSNINWLSYICKILSKYHIIKESEDYNTKQRLKELINLFKQKQTLRELDLTLLCK